MEAKELRIGNYLFDNLGRIVNIHKIELEHLNFCLSNGSVIKHNIKSFKPIQLTEELLLKFGFIKSNLDGDNSWLNLRYRFLNFASDESVNFKKVYLTLNKMDIICSYVHELQNLYFALTGEELTLKN